MRVDLPLKNERCDSVTGEGGSALVQNSMTYFMDGPKGKRYTII